MKKVMYSMVVFGSLSFAACGGGGDEEVAKNAPDAAKEVCDCYTNATDETMKDCDDLNDKYAKQFENSLSALTYAAGTAGCLMTKGMQEMGDAMGDVAEGMKNGMDSLATSINTALDTTATTEDVKEVSTDEPQ